MIINGNSRSNAKFFTKHLLNAEQNERVEVKEIRGFVADNVPDAFKEIEIIGSATRARNSFYHSNINPDEGEKLTPEQWEQAIDTLERKLGLEGQPHFVIAHEKKDREHIHVVWSRIDPDTMTVVPTTNNYYVHAEAAREIEQLFDHEPTPVPPAPERDRFKDWETFRAQESGITPAEMKAEITALWQQSDGGRAFQAAIEEKGYLLAKGDRRDFVLIDPEGDVHSLARRINGAKAADIRAKMGDLDRDSLMTAKEASAWMQAREGEAETSGSSDARVLPEEQAQEMMSERGEPSHNPKLAVLEKYAIHQRELQHATAQEFTDQQEAVLARHGWQLPYLGTHSFDDWLQRGHDSLEEQHAALPDPQHHPPDREAAPPNKQPHESWAEFITRTDEPTRTDEKQREPELEL